LVSGDRIIRAVEQVLRERRRSDVADAPTVGIISDGTR
jgi:hypothetical protein